jgi:hypothetical protein
VENILIAVLEGLSWLVRGKDKALNIIPRPLPTPDELVVVLDREIQLYPHDFGRLRALSEI